jgi:hypothetical protein
VTGSVNQHGELQAIGGVNEKIEGFYRACALGELTGRQGVIIPDANVRHLMLSKHVVDAVQAGRFHIWSAGTVDDGIELLTGLTARQRGPDGRFPEGTLHAPRRAAPRAVGAHRGAAEHHRRLGRPNGASGPSPLGPGCQWLLLTPACGFGRCQTGVTELAS